MATRNITSKIQMRRDTAANWETKNPILSAGEIGYDTTNKRTKIGDGTTAWNSLNYISELTEKISGTNLFNLNGDINTRYNGVISTANSVSNDILTSNINSTTTYSLGQFIKVTANKAYTLTVKCVSIGSGTRGNVYLYYRNNNALQFNIDFTAADTTKTITFTPAESEVLIAFSTFGGTGAQFTDIMFNLGAVALPHKPYIGEALFGGKTNEITARQRFHNIIEVEKLRGRNLFDINLVGTNSATVLTENGFQLTKSGGARFTPFINFKFSEGTYKFSYKLRGGSAIVCFQIYYTDGTEYYPPASGVFTLTKPTSSLRLYIASTELDGSFFDIYDIQIELGATATPYTPYIGSFVDEITLDQTKNDFLTQIAGLSQQIQALSADLIISFAKSGFATAISCTQAGTSKTSPFTATAAATIVITLTKPSNTAVWGYSFNDWTINGNAITSGSGGFTIATSGDTQTLSFAAGTTTKGSFVGSVERHERGGTV